MPHPNGAQRLQAVGLAVANLVEAEQTFERDYGLSATEPVEVVPFVHAMLTLKMPTGGECIRLAEPLGDGIVHDRFANAGEGICYVTITVSDLAATRSFLQRSGVSYTQWEEGLMIPATVTGGAPLAFVTDVAE